MKPSAYYISAGRGQTVDEAALIAALRERRIAGAAFDVFQTEPLPPDSPFWSLPNVFITPHVGGYIVEYEEFIMPLICRQYAGLPRRPAQRNAQHRRALGPAQAHGNSAMRPTRSGEFTKSSCASPTLASGKRAAMRVLMRPAPRSLRTVSMSFHARAADAEQVKLETDQIGRGKRQRLAALLA